MVQHRNTRTSSQYRGWNGEERRENAHLPPPPSYYQSLTTSQWSFGYRELIPLILAVGAAIGVWVNLNNEITTLKLKNESTISQQVNLEGEVKSMRLLIEDIKSAQTKDRVDITQSIQDLDNTVSQIYQKLVTKK